MQHLGLDRDEEGTLPSSHSWENQMAEYVMKLSECPSALYMHKGLSGINPRNPCPPLQLLEEKE